MKPVKKHFALIVECFSAPSKNHFFLILNLFVIVTTLQKKNLKLQFFEIFAIFKHYPTADISNV
jgi:hypothetical protein